jgi:GNAT superfamily N-acetyltransferase
MSTDEPGNFSGDTPSRAVATSIRRARRSDFTAVMRLLATTGVPVPPPDRRTLRRFRYIVDDLGADLYVALVDGTLAGLVHLTYARQLTKGPWARLELLVVEPCLRRRGIGRGLLRFALQRATKHACSGVGWCLPPEASVGATQLLAEAGFVARGSGYELSAADAAPTAPEL